ncbi:uncharacterized membrane protein YcaP (DUF421 family) [Laceyella sediminis]|jgi:uncharacterized membrane protein YcaP (DUF421 family)|uniref:Uncharacterized membrane protein YcaP, DUF421 family n=2 Tax=Laceyella TaxID=292635 RepID=A0AA46AGK4_9BACL|nr:MULTISPECIES: DUF421 domain-containing protein [Laceyella]PRZ15792.1 uncharacterized membrane protein YcaP (DUF421 family) [Laceyella sediminis]SMP28199.1 Uncharacterized membrane protein YcaP, DUF421 family [Laceyella tengchongensis]
MGSILLRTVFIYVFLLVIMRVMGKREIGKLSIFDLVVSFMIADISSMAIENKEEPLITWISPIILLAALQILLSFILIKSERIRNWVEGSPVPLIENGKIVDKNMAKLRYNLDDLLTQLREKNIPDVSDVEFAVLETTGKLSVFPKEEKRPAFKEDVRRDLKQFRMPIPVIIDGKVQEEGLKKLGQNRFWLKAEIQKRGLKDFKEVFYAAVNYEGRLYIDRKDRPTR